jgi:hypothetical protein
MKPLAKSIAFGGAGIIALAAGWFINDFVEDGNEVNYQVELKTAKDGVLDVKSNGNCKKKAHKGCLLFEEDKTGVIKFYLSGSRINAKRCPKAEAVITKIELSTTAEGSVTDGSKGDFSPPLAAWIKNYAFADVDLYTGVVYEASVNVARSQAWLINLNSHDASEGEKEFWYRVTATACGDSPTTWVTDPRGNNEGMN